ncbi:ABC transporter ATP-binding protein [Ktedonobacter racemifer]|uniref:ABC transporter related protein n=1 Tax=Ktedonobacter racemifer DSM 44963 TaxID=485913 RepID=D6TWF9_KTERA|nr:ABC transporter ATP-binding protein [Ktedonobacter racemifer]EFH84542.1 ABC transporter related protein [Ktedonobacter racemifer DSM 44963]
MDEVLVRTDQVGRTYSQGKTPVVALSSATCAILPGARIALMGPSGGGKSTLLHLLAGLDTPTSGSITWPMLGARETLRPLKIGLVFQVPSLLAPLTVVENVEIPLLLGQGSTEKARAAALDALDRIGLRSIGEKLPEELSGGQAQRVAVARALATYPKLLLADEPTGQLDHPTAQQLFDVLLESLEGTETALVVATHDRIVAERMNTIWHMHHGLLEVQA